MKKKEPLTYWEALTEQLDDILQTLIRIDIKLKEQNEYWKYWKKLKNIHQIDARKV
jgi:hypothetical protein